MLENKLPLVNQNNQQQEEDEFDETFDERPQSNEKPSEPEAPAIDTPPVESEKLTVNGLTVDDLSLEDDSTTNKDTSVAEPEKPVGYEQFAKDFERYLGIPLEGAKQMMAELQGFRVETLVEKQQRQLKDKWGDSYDERFNAVADYFAKLPEAKQKALDNVEGAELIWAKLSMEQQAVKNSQTPQVPHFNTGKTANVHSRTSTGNKPVLQYSDIVRMSPSEYRARQAEIQAAFDDGRVNMDDADFI